MKFLTFTNFGCVDICKNMLTSAEKVGLNIDDFIIACMDKESLAQLTGKYSGAFLFTEVDSWLSTYQYGSLDETSGFRKLGLYKWKIVKSVYDNFPNLCWVDCDIVFVKNPIHILSGNQKILIQSDLPAGALLCAGFFVLNDTDVCRQLVNECYADDFEDDQILLNKIAPKYTEHIMHLPLEFFPNGHVYFVEATNKSAALIVHNNHIAGHDEKISRFKNENLWYI